MFHGKHNYESFISSNQTPINPSQNSSIFHCHNDQETNHIPLILLSLQKSIPHSLRVNRKWRVERQLWRMCSTRRALRSAPNWTTQMVILWTIRLITTFRTVSVRVINQELWTLGTKERPRNSNDVHHQHSRKMVHMSLPVRNISTHLYWRTVARITTQRICPCLMM